MNTFDREGHILKCIRRYDELIEMAKSTIKKCEKSNDRLHPKIQYIKYISEHRLKLMEKMKEILEAAAASDVSEEERAKALFEKGEIWLPETIRDNEIDYETFKAGYYRGIDSIKSQIRTKLEGIDLSSLLSPKKKEKKK